MSAPRRVIARVIARGGAHGIGTNAALFRLAWLEPEPARVFAGLRGPDGQRLSVVHRGVGGEVVAIASSPAHGLVANTDLVADDGPPVAIAPERLGAIASAIAAQFMESTGRDPALIDTGVKVIDVLAPLVDGGIVWVFGLHDSGRMKFIEELHLRVAPTGQRLTVVFPIIPSYAATIPAHLHAQPSFPPDVNGGVRSVWLVSEAAGDPGATALVPSDRGSRFVFNPALAQRGCYPAIDCAATRASDDALARVEAGQRELIAQIHAAATNPEASGILPTLERYFAQPFESARDFTGLAGTHVARREACTSCADILAGHAPRGGYDLPTGSDVAQ
ncbi:hypothetical protein [Enhygromyxa salina]|uniref:F0F1 ATP synthase subunit beta n=1 Tax=Enhygromyxa salina TaxID=215803 RepID=A0A2S9Y5S5_9BACT|nr:hypothetical protein [Enhygromyxa salina]PRQ00448.1 F0F1 ATP synthase subunit beta [Enhygromyxa salina]